MLNALYQARFVKSVNGKLAFIKLGIRAKSDEQAEKLGLLSLKYLKLNCSCQ